MTLRPCGVVVVGASAGGVEALRAMAGGLPGGLPVSIAVVLHLPAGGSSALASILDRVGGLPATTAVDGTKLTGGQIHVAPPDRHLVVGRESLSLSDSLPERGHRPSINILFRSAAMAWGPAVTGVLLSGVLDDGVDGLLAIAARGGRVVVQEPSDALYPDMPEHALRTLTPDHVVPASGIGAVLSAHHSVTTEGG